MEVLRPPSFNDFFKSNLQEIRQKGERFGTTSPCISHQDKTQEKGKGKQWKEDLGSKQRQLLVVPQETKQRNPQSLQDFVNNQLTQIREKGECLGTTSPCEKMRSKVSGKEKSIKMKEPKVGSWDYINCLEERERSRRLTELAIHKEISSSGTKFQSNLAQECENRKRRLKFTRDLEEAERAWRLRTLFSKHYKYLEDQRASYITSHRGYQGKCKILDAPRSGVQSSNVNDLEEQERQRRMNEMKEAENESEREREKAMDFTIRAEEEERQRRMKLLEKSRKGGFRNVESEITKSSEIKTGEEKSRE